MPRDPHNRDDALSGYVRKRIRDWEASGRQLLELARIAGTSKATPSQVKRGLGVGGRSVDGFARAFGFGEDVEAFKRAAYEWWMAQGKAGAEAVDKPMTEAQGVAIEMLLGLNQGTRAQMEAILADYTAPRFASRDETWWFETLAEELRFDRDSLAADGRLRAEVQGKEKVVRAGQEVKRREKARTKASPDSHGKKRAS